jgi:hypothetical protein
MIRQWYGSLLLMRAQMLGELGREAEAGRLQELGTAFSQP